MPDHDEVAAGTRRPGELSLAPGEEYDDPVVTDEAGHTASRRFRDALGRYCSGITVVTSMADGQPLGMTCQSFTSVSLDPPLVAFLPTRRSRTFPLLRRSGHFCVNFLAADQAEISRAMAAPSADRFAGVSWRRSRTGAPLLDGIVGYVDCTVAEVHEAGDHYLVIGAVQDLGFTVDEATGASPDPLLYFEGRYRTLG